jgi:hypothetical protein
MEASRTSNPGPQSELGKFLFQLGADLSRQSVPPRHGPQPVCFRCEEREAMRGDDLCQPCWIRDDLNTELRNDMMAEDRERYDEGSDD